MSLTGTRVPLPQDLLVHRAVEAHAHRHPERTAVTCGRQSLTFAELNARANRTAHLLAARGVGRGSVVGVCLDRTPELMTTILGVLKAGAAYVPLDPSYPAERLELMLGQLDRVKVNVASAETRGLVAGAFADTLVLEDETDALASAPATDPGVEMANDDLCYVVFTSGSTGTPKATAVRHDGWYNLLEWLRLAYRLDHDSSGLSVSSFGFDISQRGLMAPLFTGAAIHLLPSRSFDPGMAYRLIAEHGVKTLHCAPSTLYLLTDLELMRGTDALMAVDYVFIGGEPLNTARVEEWATREGNGCTLLHQYGVAECTDVATSHVLADYPRYRTGPTPVGTPVYNTEIRLLDDRLREVPDGETGEICISGRSVSAGYLNGSPEDARRFTETETGTDGRRERIYRTGDLGRITPEGELVVVGRADTQVKIRGMRIDLGDVEHRVRAHPAVRDAVVLALPDPAGETSLVAFVLAAGDAVEPRTLRADLLAALPRNMVPQEFVPLPSFPLNPNGKTDRRALAAAARPAPHPAGA
ncbi:amino acid adenylation domain-containing protein [Streptomyces sp. TRM 70351]|uniref:amino acid adenylation domain-containing protein n=1 Tax=Streptomyces sp. TRM 70351 TaxID=3116552 RepID=UPI002E7C1F1D|nr:amino acid adenylation domain-containing protein [Streptomyces sp. TRM 70351]MEE1927331.1 amino acid adenylation domain-containing protein [Streptomyces sp. TRM 70351]